MEHKRFIGSEKLILDGKELPYSMVDFWSAKFSAILLNMNRGSFAEFLVLCAMAENGDHALWAETVKAGVEPYDIDGPEITTPHGKRKSRIEVKCAASVQLDDKQRTIIMQWFMYGGGVLGLGLLLGLVLPHLIPSRKRKDRWMN